jgi:hypothetical protein
MKTDISSDANTVLCRVVAWGITPVRRLGQFVTPHVEQQMETTVFDGTYITNSLNYTQTGVLANEKLLFSISKLGSDRLSVKYKSTTSLTTTPTAHNKNPK